MLYFGSFKEYLKEASNESCLKMEETYNVLPYNQN